jgi:putative spermidine/putrescine transport system permease protein
MTALSTSEDPIATSGSSAPIGFSRRVNALFTRRRGLGLAATLTPPLLWLLVVYVGSLVLLTVTAFFELDPLTQKPTTTLTLANLDAAFTTSAYYATIFRSITVGVAVTFLCLAISLPMAFYMAKVARPRIRRSLVVAALLPLWAGYLVKAYAWRAMLEPGSEFGISSSGGFLKSVFGWSPGFGLTGVILTLSYMWLPYMLLPIYAGLDRLPASLLDASGDLGARPWRTFRSVIMPMLVPSIAAGSIFTFSLSLGDYITANVVGGKVQLIGNLIGTRFLLAPNQPLAAAFTLWPILIVVVYLFAMSKLRAFESL